MDSVPDADGDITANSIKVAASLVNDLREYGDGFEFGSSQEMMQMVQTVSSCKAMSKDLGSCAADKRDN